jgi:hypothetical protein
MDRKQFLGTSLRLSACCGAALLLDGALSRVRAEGSGPSCEGKVEFVKQWVVDIMQQLDAALDQPTRERLMEANGRACYVGAYGEAKPPSTPPDLDEWLSGFQKHVGRENLWREGDAIHFKYVGNPAGLKIADGYCLCPIVEDGPRALSPTYCHCSVGYVTEIFKRGSGRTATVTLVDSLRRGGQECHFLVRLA